MKDIFGPPLGEKRYHRYQSQLEKKLQQPINSFINFVNNQITASLLLVGSTLIAIILASTETTHYYYTSIQTLNFTLGIGDTFLSFTVKNLVNDFLMTFFFFLLGLEIKKEFIAGDLGKSKVRNTAILVAIGGVVVPFCVFMLLCNEPVFRKGWGIAVATDTAFALGLLSLFRKKLPQSLFTFLAALAVIDDIIAILILGVFYTHEIQMIYLGYSLGIILVLVSLNVIGIRSFIPYLVVGCLLWLLIGLAGIHGTFAGVLVALSIPARPRRGPKHVSEQLYSLTEALEATENKSELSIIEDGKKSDIVEKIEDVAHEATIPIVKVRRIIEPYVFLIVVPVFGFVNAGVPFSYDIIAVVFQYSLAQGLFFGLLIGKFLGISCTTWVVIHFKIGELPDGANMKHIVGISFFAGIGFTMSLYIAELAFGATEYLYVAKAAVFCASFISGILGCAYFTFLRSTE